MESSETPKVNTKTLKFCTLRTKALNLVILRPFRGPTSDNVSKVWAVVRRYIYLRTTAEMIASLSDTLDARYIYLASRAMKLSTHIAILEHFKALPP
jgi:hypothetical protein